MADKPVMELVKEPTPEPSVVCSPAVVGFDAAPQQTPRAVTADPPSMVIFPPELAEFRVIEEGTVVVRTAAPGVKVKSLPLEVPDKFTATNLKWMGVPGTRLVIFAVTDTTPGADPAETVGVELP